jgi:hypothetical protein
MGIILLVCMFLLLIVIPIAIVVVVIIGISRAATRGATRVSYRERQKLDAYNAEVADWNARKAAWDKYQADLAAWNAAHDVNA